MRFGEIRGHSPPEFELLTAVPECPPVEKLCGTQWEWSELRASDFFENLNFLSQTLGVS